MWHTYIYIMWYIFIMDIRMRYVYHLDTVPQGTTGIRGADAAALHAQQVTSLLRPLARAKRSRLLQKTLRSLEVLGLDMFGWLGSTSWGFPLSAHIHKSLVKRFLNGFFFFSRFNFDYQDWRVRYCVYIQFDLYRANTLCVGVSLWIFLNSCDQHTFFFLRTILSLPF